MVSEAGPSHRACDDEARRGRSVRRRGYGDLLRCSARSPHHDRRGGLRVPGCGPCGNEGGMDGRGRGRVRDRGSRDHCSRRSGGPRLHPGVGRRDARQPLTRRETAAAHGQCRTTIRDPPDRVSWQPARARRAAARRHRGSAARPRGLAGWRPRARRARDVLSPGGVPQRLGASGRDRDRGRRRHAAHRRGRGRAVPPPRDQHRGPSHRICGRCRKDVRAFARCSVFTGGHRSRARRDRREPAQGRLQRVRRHVARRGRRGSPRSRRRHQRRGRIATTTARHRHFGRHADEPRAHQPGAQAGDRPAGEPFRVVPRATAAL